MPGPEQLLQTIRHERLVSGLSNLVFNALAAWFMLRSGPNLTLSGEHSYAIDIAATAFILPFIVTLIVIPLNRRKLATGKVSAVYLNEAVWLESRLLDFPENLWLRASLIGFFTMLVATPAILAPLWALGMPEFTPLAYALFKGCWAGLIAAAITRPLLLLALKSN